MNQDTPPDPNFGKESDMAMEKMKEKEAYDERRREFWRQVRIKRLEAENAELRAAANAVVNAEAHYEGQFNMRPYFDALKTALQSSTASDK